MIPDDLKDPELILNITQTSESRTELREKQSAIHRKKKRKTVTQKTELTNIQTLAMNESSTINDLIVKE